MEMTDYLAVANYLSVGCGIVAVLALWWRHNAEMKRWR